MHEGHAASIVLSTLDSLLEGFQIISSDFRYLFVNETAARHGRRAKAELVDRLMSEVYPGIEDTEMFAVLRRCVQERTVQRMENEFTYDDGRRSWFELAFHPVPEGVCILSADITERKQAEQAVKSLEEQLSHAQKMEAIGRLAAGVAHDLNNIVSVIQLNCALLGQQLKSTAESYQDLVEIQKAGHRASALTKQLLTLGRGQVFELRSVDLNVLLAAERAMLSRLAGKELEVTLLPGTGLHPVLADTNQLSRVLMNLVLNACDAMPHGGRLTIETANVHLNGKYTSTHLGVAQGDYVMLAVTDTGIGMDAATQARIFEPFFTTKEPGKGTGLGLPTAYGIIKQSGGHIWVYSEPGQGTSVKVYLPREVEGVMHADVPHADPADVTGSETVLIVENDTQVLAAAAEVLAKSGYRVLVAPTAHEARRQAAAQPVDLLLTDVNLDGINGVELAREIKRDRASLRIICMSGFTDEAAVRNGIVSASLAFLQKPLTPDSLLKKVRRVLDAR